MSSSNNGPQAKSNIGEHLKRSSAAHIPKIPINDAAAHNVIEGPRTISVPRSERRRSTTGSLGENFGAPPVPAGDISGAPPSCRKSRTDMDEARESSGGRLNDGYSARNMSTKLTARTNRSEGGAEIGGGRVNDGHSARNMSTKLTARTNRSEGGAEIGGQHNVFQPTSYRGVGGEVGGVRKSAPLANAERSTYCKSSVGISRGAAGTLRSGVDKNESYAGMEKKRRLSAGQVAGCPPHVTSNLKLNLDSGLGGKRKREDNNVQASGVIPSARGKGELIGKCGTSKATSTGGGKGHNRATASSVSLGERGNQSSRGLSTKAAHTGNSGQEKDQDEEKKKGKGLEQPPPKRGGYTAEDAQKNVSKKAEEERKKKKIQEAEDTKKKLALMKVDAEAKESVRAGTHRKERAGTRFPVRKESGARLKNNEREKLKASKGTPKRPIIIVPQPKVESARSSRAPPMTPKHPEGRRLTVTPRERKKPKLKKVGIRRIADNNESAQTGNPEDNREEPREQHNFAPSTTSVVVQNKASNRGGVGPTMGAPAPNFVYHGGSSNAEERVRREGGTGVATSSYCGTDEGEEHSVGEDSMAHHTTGTTTTRVKRDTSAIDEVRRENKSALSKMRNNDSALSPFSSRQQSSNLTRNLRKATRKEIERINKDEYKTQSTGSYEEKVIDHLGKGSRERWGYPIEAPQTENGQPHNRIEDMGRGLDAHRQFLRPGDRGASDYAASRAELHAHQAPLELQRDDQQQQHRQQQQRHHQHRHQQLHHHQQQQQQHHQQHQYQHEHQHQHEHYQQPQQPQHQQQLIQQQADHQGIEEPMKEHFSPAPEEMDDEDSSFYPRPWGDTDPSQGGRLADSSVEEQRAINQTMHEAVFPAWHREDPVGGRGEREERMRRYPQTSVSHEGQFMENNSELRIRNSHRQPSKSGEPSELLSASAPSSYHHDQAIPHDQQDRDNVYEQRNYRSSSTSKSHSFVHATLSSWQPREEPDNVGANNISQQYVRSKFEQETMFNVREDYNATVQVSEEYSRQRHPCYREEDKRNKGTARERDGGITYTSYSQSHMNKEGSSHAATWESEARGITGLQDHQQGCRQEETKANHIRPYVREGGQHVGERPGGPYRREGENEAPYLGAARSERMRESENGMNHFQARVQELGMGRDTNGRMRDDSSAFPFTRFIHTMKSHGIDEDGVGGTRPWSLSSSSFWNTQREAHSPLLGAKNKNYLYPPSPATPQSKHDSYRSRGEDEMRLNYTSNSGKRKPKEEGFEKVEKLFHETKNLISSSELSGASSGSSKIESNVDRISEEARTPHPKSVYEDGGKNNTSSTCSHFGDTKLRDSFPRSSTTTSWRGFESNEGSTMVDLSRREHTALKDVQSKAFFSSSGAMDAQSSGEKNGGPHHACVPKSRGGDEQEDRSKVFIDTRPLSSSSFFSRRGEEKDKGHDTSKSPAMEAAKAKRSIHEEQHREQARSMRSTLPRCTNPRHADFFDHGNGSTKNRSTMREGDGLREWNTRETGGDHEWTNGGLGPNAMRRTMDGGVHDAGLKESDAVGMHERPRGSEAEMEKIEKAAQWKRQDMAEKRDGGSSRMDLEYPFPRPATQLEKDLERLNCVFKTKWHQVSARSEGSDAALSRVPAMLTRISPRIKTCAAESTNDDDGEDVAGATSTNPRVPIPGLIKPNDGHRHTLAIYTPRVQTKGYSVSSIHVAKENDEPSVYSDVIDARADKIASKSKSNLGEGEERKRVDNAAAAGESNTAKIASTVGLRQLLDGSASITMDGWGSIDGSWEQLRRYHEEKYATDRAEIINEGSHDRRGSKEKKLKELHKTYEKIFTLIEEKKTNNRRRYLEMWDACMLISNGIETVKTVSGTSLLSPRLPELQSKHISQRLSLVEKGAEKSEKEVSDACADDENLLKNKLQMHKIPRASSVGGRSSISSPRAVSSPREDKTEDMMFALEQRPLLVHHGEDSIASGTPRNGTPTPRTGPPSSRRGAFSHRGRLDRESPRDRGKRPVSPLRKSAESSGVESHEGFFYEAGSSIQKAPSSVSGSADGRPDAQDHSLELGHTLRVRTEVDWDRAEKSRMKVSAFPEEALPETESEFDAGDSTVEVIPHNAELSDDPYCGVRPDVSLMQASSQASAKIEDSLSIALSRRVLPTPLGDLSSSLSEEKNEEYEEFLLGCESQEESLLSQTQHSVRTGVLSSPRLSVRLDSAPMPKKRTEARSNVRMHESADETIVNELTSAVNLDEDKVIAVEVKEDAKSNAKSPIVIQEVERDASSRASVASVHAEEDEVAISGHLEEEEEEKQKEKEEEKEEEKEAEIEREKEIEIQPEIKEEQEEEKVEGQDEEPEFRALSALIQKAHNRIDDYYPDESSFLPSFEAKALFPVDHSIPAKILETQNDNVDEQVVTSAPNLDSYEANERGPVIPVTPSQRPESQREKMEAKELLNVRASIKNDEENDEEKEKEVPDDAWIRHRTGLKMPERVTEEIPRDSAEPLTQVTEEITLDSPEPQTQKDEEEDNVLPMRFEEPLRRPEPEDDRDDDELPVQAEEPLRQPQPVQAAGQLVDLTFILGPYYESNEGASESPICRESVNEIHRPPSPVPSPTSRNRRVVPETPAGEPRAKSEEVTETVVNRIIEEPKQESSAPLQDRILGTGEHAAGGSQQVEDDDVECTVETSEAFLQQLMAFKNITSEDTVLSLDEHYLCPDEILTKFIGLIEIERLHKLSPSGKSDMEAWFVLLIDLWNELLVALPQELLDEKIGMKWKTGHGMPPLLKNYKKNPPRLTMRIMRKRFLEHIRFGAPKEELEALGLAPAHYEYADEEMLDNEHLRQLIHNEIRSEEIKWLDYHEDAIWIKNEISNRIWDDLMEELVADMMMIPP